MRDYQRRFIELALRRQALRFGEFTLKSGRVSPYFFNAGLFNDGDAIATLGACYAAALLQSGVGSTCCSGPPTRASRWSPLPPSRCRASHARNVPWAYNRKEAKDHGEAGVLSAARSKGRIVIVDDVITAGTAIRESIELIRGAGATPVAVSLALDRQERGLGRALGGAGNDGAVRPQLRRNSYAGRPDRRPGSARTASRPGAEPAQIDSSARLPSQVWGRGCGLVRLRGARSRAQLAPEWTNRTLSWPCAQPPGDRRLSDRWRSRRGIGSQ